MPQGSLLDRARALKEIHKDSEIVVPQAQIIEIIGPENTNIVRQGNIRIYDRTRKCLSLMHNFDHYSRSIPKTYLPASICIFNQLEELGTIFFFRIFGMIIAALKRGS